MWHLPLLILFQSRVLPLLHISNKFVVYGTYWLWGLFVIFPLAFLSYILTEKPWMKLGDRWRGAIEKQRREKLKARAALPAPSLTTAGETNTVAPQEAVSR